MKCGRVSSRDPALSTEQRVQWTELPWEAQRIQPTAPPCGDLHREHHRHLLAPPGAPEPGQYLEPRVGQVLAPSPGGFLPLEDSFPTPPRRVNLLSFSSQDSLPSNFCLSHSLSIRVKLMFLLFNKQIPVPDCNA